jgi:hypothetical protein
MTLLFYVVTSYGLVGGYPTIWRKIPPPSSGMKIETVCFLETPESNGVTTQENKTDMFNAVRTPDLTSDRWRRSSSCANAWLVTQFYDIHSVSRKKL